MILHTVNKSPFAADSLGQCLRFAAADDAIVLIEDGVYAATRGYAESLATGELPVYALVADIQARGLTERLGGDIQPIDYDEFVDLCTQYDVIKNW